jgi:hypothetical protein
MLFKQQATTKASLRAEIVRACQIIRACQIKLADYEAKEGEEPQPSPTLSAEIDRLLEQAALPGPCLEDFDLYWGAKRPGSNPNGATPGGEFQFLLMATGKDVSGAMVGRIDYLVVGGQKRYVITNLFTGHTVAYKYIKQAKEELIQHVTETVKRAEFVADRSKKEATK